jgi:ubiquinone/menaquinone biosynthesis C-methylase UbiE
VTPGPDPAEARRRYDDMAAGYDRQIGLQSSRLGRYQEGLRKRAVEALQLTGGETVLDVGCGTGASFARLVAAVGPEGRVLGVDQSSGMLAVAKRRIAELGAENVDLLETPIQDAQFPATDAAIFFLTHDLMRTPAALDNVVAAVKPGGRVVAAGMQRPSGLFAPIGFLAWLGMRRYVTTDEGLRKPWDLLAARLADVETASKLLGTMYLVAGHRAVPTAG